MGHTPGSSNKCEGPRTSQCPLQGTFFLQRSPGLKNFAVSKGSDSDGVKESSTVPSQGWRLHLVLTRETGREEALCPSCWILGWLLSAYTLPYPNSPAWNTGSPGPGVGEGMLTTADLNLKCEAKATYGRDAGCRGSEGLEAGVKRSGTSG